MIDVLACILVILFTFYGLLQIILRFILRMQTDDARYLKRKVKSGAIDVHPTEKALVVNYELEAVILGELGDPMHGDKKECQKIIRLKNLNSKTDCAALAKDVIDKCSLIHPSKLDEVEQLIYYLKNRKKNQRAASAALNSPNSRPGSCAINSATINNIDEYVELLYEDLSEKIKGSALILELAKNPDNLEELSKNEAAISALTRVLREDWRKSIDLSTNIICTLFFFSTYVEFHTVIIHYKIGSLCMDILEQEFKRYDQWQQELEGFKNSDKDTMSTSMSDSMIRKSRIPEPTRRPRSGLWMSDPNKFKSEDSESEDPNNKTNDVEKTKKQIALLIKKQDQLLRVSFYLLLNISEDEKIEEKMVRRGIVEMLVKAVDRNNLELVTLVVTFLKKLSIKEENKDEMAELNVIDKLPRLLGLQDAELVHVTLKLLLNLSFDRELVQKMVEIELLPKLVELLSDEKHQNVVLKLLYHFSRESEMRSMFVYTDCVQLVVDMILLFRDPTVDIELLALVINLARDVECAQCILEKKLFRDLMLRTLKYKDTLLMKMLRNLSEHKFAKHDFLEFVGDITKSIIDNKNPDFALECVGVLGNLNLPEIDFLQLFTRLDLITWIRNVIDVEGEINDDVLVLDVIVLLGTAAQDIGCAELLCKQGIMSMAVQLLQAKQVDDEIVLQIIYLFYQVLAHTKLREFVIKETEATAYLIDLMRDKNEVVRQWCIKSLDFVSMADERWAERIKVEKFRAHNAQWIEMVENHDIDSAEYADPNEELPPYLNPSFLTTHDIESITPHEIDNEDTSKQMTSPDLSVSRQNLTSPNDNDELKSQFVPYSTLD